MFDLCSLTVTFSVLIQTSRERSFISQQLLFVVNKPKRHVVFSLETEVSTERTNLRRQQLECDLGCCDHIRF